MNYEAHLPTQQTSPQKINRLPGQDENHRRAKSNQPAPPRRTQDSFCLSCLKSTSRFPKELRLRSRREFHRVSKEGQRRVGRFLCVDVRSGEKLKLGISASGRYGDSHERNRFKRLVREAFRTSYALLPPRLELNVIPRQGAKNAVCSDIRTELLRLLKP